MTFDEYANWAENRSGHQHRIDEFMRLANQELPQVPCVPSEDVRLLRAKLILEEAIETIKALGVGLWFIDGEGYWDFGDHEIVMDQVQFTAGFNPNLIEIADGCADLSVVTIGTLSACGIGDKDLLECVDRNNLAKFGPGHSIRADGKLVKPADHQPPDIAGVLKAQGWDDARAPLPSV